jgi:hypothetical protein
MNRLKCHNSTNAQQNITTSGCAEQPKQKRRLLVLIAIACVLGVFALVWPRFRDWQSQRTLVSQLNIQLCKIEKLSTIPLNGTRTQAFGGLQVGGTKFGQLTVEVSGWYKVTQHRLNLDTERDFLRERVVALCEVEPIANSLPDAKSKPLMEAFHRCQAKWHSVVPSEITDDENCNWDKLAVEVNSALAAFAKEVRELPYVR